MGILTRTQAQDIDFLKVILINDLWAAENTALDNVSWDRMNQRLACLHSDLMKLHEYLGCLPIDDDQQSVPYPFSENGGGSDK